MAKRTWLDWLVGNTPITAAKLNDLEGDVEAALLQLARDPAQLFAGAIVRDVDGAPTSAVVVWPDGVDGTYAGTASVSFPGAVSAYTVTRATTPTVTFTQPAVTRDAITGLVSNRPPITVS